MAIQVAHGSYTGNATDNRDITVSPSFAIKAVFIKENGTNGGGVMSFSGMGDKSKRLDADAATFTNGIQSMGTGTFQIGTSSRVNNSGTTFYWFALGGDDADIVASSYVGNDADNRQITTNFLPEMVIVIGDGTFTDCTARFGQLAGDNALVFVGTGNTTGANYIQQFNSTGFQIGSNAGINFGSETYYYLAIKSKTNAYTNSYAGNSTDNRDITAPNFQPLVVMVKGASKNGCFYTASSPADSTSVFDASSNSADVIQSLASTGFQVGTDTRSNATGTTYYYYAINNTETTTGIAARVALLGVGI